MTLDLGLLSPHCSTGRLYSNAVARKMVLCVSMLIVLTGLSIEGAGAVIDHGVKVALLRPTAEGPQNERRYRETGKLPVLLLAGCRRYPRTFQPRRSHARRRLPPFERSYEWHRGPQLDDASLADVLASSSGLGLIFRPSHVAEKMNPNRLVSFLVAAVMISGVGLFAWYRPVTTPAAVHRLPDLTVCGR